jgi:nucleotide-binding universal stress UspA family protein
MTTILIATDFTAAAKNATKYAFALAKSMEAKIILFNSYNHFSSVSNTGYSTISITEKAIYEKLTEDVKRFDPAGELEVKTECLAGLSSENIIKFATQNKASFIVVGMKENGKKIKKLFGSTVISLTTESQIPVIVVPEKAEVSVPKKIVLGSDLNNENSIDTVRPLKRIVESFNSRLSIVRVIDRYVDEPVEMLMRCSKPDWFLRSVNPDYEFLQENDARKAIIEYLENTSTDMLAIISHHLNIFERIMYGSITNYFSFNTRIPLLILPSLISPTTEINQAALDFCSGACLTDNDGVPQCNKYHKMQHEYNNEVNESER